MVELTLPKNSQIKQGKSWPAQKAAATKEFRIYRYDPDSVGNPQVDTYVIDAENCGPMVLDGLIKLMEQMHVCMQCAHTCTDDDHHIMARRAQEPSLCANTHWSTIWSPSACEKRSAPDVGVKTDASCSASSMPRRASIRPAILMLAALLLAF